MRSAKAAFVVSYRFETHPFRLRIRGNIGLTGFGKSSLMAYQLAQVERLLTGKPISRIFQVSSKRDEHNFKTGVIVETPAAMQRIISSTPDQFNIRLVTRNINHFEFVCFAAQLLGDCWLFLDEVGRYSSPTKAGTKMKPERFDEIVCEGSGKNIAIVWAAQRPTQIHNDLLKETQETNIFCTDDLDGLGGTLQTKDNQRLARNLQPLAFFWCQRGKEPALCLVPKNG